MSDKYCAICKTYPHDDSKLFGKHNDYVCEECVKKSPWYRDALRERDGWKRDHGYEVKWHGETRDKLSAAEREVTEVRSRLSEVRKWAELNRGPLQAIVWDDLDVILGTEDDQSLKGE